MYSVLLGYGIKFYQNVKKTLQTVFEVEFNF